VFCADPLPEQNDDGEKYINFLLNAPHYFSLQINHRNF
jgi:hypothetical protein